MRFARYGLSLAALLSILQSACLADFMAVGGIDLGPRTFSFSDPTVVTQSFRIFDPNTTTRVDFLLGGNGQGTFQVDVFEVSEDAQIVGTVVSQNFAIPSTGSQPGDAVSVSVPFVFNVATEDQNFLLVLSATGGTAFVAEAIHTFQLGGGVGQTHSTSLPITNPNQGTNLIFSPMHFQVYGTVQVPEPSAVLLASFAVAFLARRRS